MQRRPTLKPDGRKVTLIVLYIPSVERDGYTPVAQDAWVQKALEFFGSVFGGATASPRPRASGGTPSATTRSSTTSRS